MIARAASTAKTAERIMDATKELFVDNMIAELPKADRARRLAQLVAVCDLRTWELLRIRSGLSRHQTELALHELLNPLITKD